MPDDIAIKVENLSKCYQIYDQPRDRLLQMLARGRKKYYREFWALKDVSFEIKKGETVGIIGRNGSGKSTLLQLICGTVNPSSGSIKINGRVAALLELGAGFNPEFTGRENVRLSAALYGLSEQEIDERFSLIEVFADIGTFIDQPVKTYSSGMYVRLAFAVIAHVNADVLVVDEALSVGDAFFTQKCMRFLREFMKNGTVFFVSHDTGAVVNLCTKAILLGRGEVIESGTPKDVTERYLATLYEGTQEISGIATISQLPPSKNINNKAEYRDMRESLINASTLRNDIEVFKFNPNDNGFGTGGAEVVSVRLLDEAGSPLSWIVGGEDVVLEVICRAHDDLSRPIVGFLFKDRLGQVVFADNTYITYQNNPQNVASGKSIITNFKFRMPVLPVGDYSISVALADGTQENHVQLHWKHDALIVRSHSSSVCFGLVGIPMRNISMVVA